MIAHHVRKPLQKHKLLPQTDVEHAFGYASQHSVFFSRTWRTRAPVCASLGHATHTPITSPHVPEACPDRARMCLVSCVRLRRARADASSAFASTSRTPCMRAEDVRDSAWFLFFAHLSPASPTQQPRSRTAATLHLTSTACYGTLNLHLASLRLARLARHGLRLRALLAAADLLLRQRTPADYIN